MCVHACVCVEGGVCVCVCVCMHVLFLWFACFVFTSFSTKHILLLISVWPWIKSLWWDFLFYFYSSPKHFPMFLLFHGFDLFVSQYTHASALIDSPITSTFSSTAHPEKISTHFLFLFSPFRPVCTLPHLDLDLPATLPCALHPAVALTSDANGPDEGRSEHSAGSVPPELPGGGAAAAWRAGHSGGRPEGRAGGQVRQGPQERQGQEQRQEKEVERSRWMPDHRQHGANQIGLLSGAEGIMVGWLVRLVRWLVG